MTSETNESILFEVMKEKKGFVSWEDAGPRKVIKLDERALDDTRDIAADIVDHLIGWGAWDKTDQPESEVCPKGLQDDIQRIINEALGVKEKI